MKFLTLNLEKILSESPFPAFIIDNNNRILRANEAFLQFLNKKREEVEGKYCYELIHGLKEIPEFCPLKEGEVCLLTGCSLDKPECPLCPIESCKENPSSKVASYRFKEFFDPTLKKYLRVDLFTLYDERGEITGYLHFIEDRTEERNFLSF